MSHSPQDYAANLLSFKNKYYKQYRACYDYCASWFKGPWSNWQIYHNKPGQANTNSNIESFNNVIKKKYTNRSKLSLKAALLEIMKLILSYSTEPLEFEIYPKFTIKVKQLEDKLDKRNFKKTGLSKYQYESLNTDSKYTITINCPKCHNKCSCTCKTFVKLGVCMHVVALSVIFKLNLFHPKYSTKSKPDTFVTKEKRGRKSRKAFGKALDKPKASTKPISSTPNSTPKRPVKKPRKEKGVTVATRKSTRKLNI